MITHGNGPQVGLLALESAHDPALSRPYPLDVLGAQTQGMIGYWLVQALQNALPGRQVACLVSQTLVAPDDPAFAHPTKFVGPVYDEQQARAPGREPALADPPGRQRVAPGGALARADRTAGPDGRPGAARRGGDRGLLRRGRRTGHGVNGTGPIRGVEAVVDKDLTAALLARQLDADALLLLTDVAAVQDGYGTPQARPIRRATPAELRARNFPAGSMGPKIEAVCRFVETTGKPAAIGQLGDAQALLAGEAGTLVTR